MKLKFLIFIFIITVVSLALLSIFTGREESVPSKSPSPISSPSIKVQGIDEDYNRSAREIIPKILESDKRANIIGQLLDKLPYEETSFSLSYDYEKNIFTAVIKSADRNLGLAELDSFLLDNGIEERSWITNLVIR